MRGVVRQDGTPVKFQYEQGLDTDTYTAVLDGETFKGKSVFADSRSGTAWGLDSGAVIFTETTSGHMLATLFGDKGATMRCNMHYADSSGFTTMGGVGVCQHSDGRVIDVMW